MPRSASPRRVHRMLQHTQRPLARMPHVKVNRQADRRLRCAAAGAAAPARRRRPGRPGRPPRPRLRPRPPRRHRRRPPGQARARGWRCRPGRTGAPGRAARARRPRRGLAQGLARRPAGPRRRRCPRRRRPFPRLPRRGSPAAPLRCNRRGRIAQFNSVTRARRHDQQALCADMTWRPHSTPSRADRAVCSVSMRAGLVCGGGAGRPLASDGRASPSPPLTAHQQPVNAPWPLPRVQARGRVAPRRAPAAARGAAQVGQLLLGGRGAGVDIRLLVHSLVGLPLIVLPLIGLLVALKRVRELLARLLLRI